MSAFEYILIPIAIIMGYAVTLVLRSWAQLIRSKNSFAEKLLYLSSTLILLSLLFMNFSGLWAYREMSFEIVGGALLLLPLLLMSAPMLAFTLTISILVPSERESYDSIEAHYWSISRSFFLVLAIALLTTIVPDFLPGVISAPPIAPTLVAASCVVILALSKNVWVHRIGHMLLYYPLAFTIFDQTTYVA